MRTMERLYIMIKTIFKKWGTEEWIVNDEYCGKVLTFLKGMTSSIHYHKNKKETFFIILGGAYIESSPVKDFMKNRKFVKRVTLHKWMSFTLPPFTVHRITCFRSRSVIVEISNHHKNSDVYRINEK